MKRTRLFAALAAALLSACLFSARARAAEILPLETDPAPAGPVSGSFCLTVTDPEHVADGGFFTAELSVEDRYDPAQIKALSPGDTVEMNGRTWTVREIVMHGADEPGREASYEIYPEEEYYGYLAFTPRPDGTYSALIDDWVPVTPVGEVKVMLPLPDRFSYVSISAGEENEPEGMDAFLEALRLSGDFNAYNTSCEFEDGTLTKVVHSSYPQGPEEDWPGIGGESGSGEIPVWAFFHGNPDLLETAVITGSALDCEAGPVPYEMTEDEKNELRTLALRGVVTGKESDEMLTGNTWLYSFETPEGEHIMTVEMYRGLLVGPDGMYAWELIR